MEKCYGSRAGMCADGRADYVDKEALDTESALYLICHKLRVLFGVAVADENNIIFKVTVLDCFFHVINKGKKGFLTSSHVAKRDKVSFVIHMKNCMPNPPSRLRLRPCLLIVKQLFASLNETLYCKLR